MKTKLILLITFLLLILPCSTYASMPDIQNIIWQDDYTIKFDSVENAASYQYSFSVNSSKSPSKLFIVNNFETENKTIHFYPKEALEYFNSTTPSVYRVWITALDKNNNQITNLTPSKGGKIIIFSKLNLNNNIIPAKKEEPTIEVTLPKPENKTEQENEKEEIVFPKPASDNNTWDNPFSDVTENTWYYNSIKFSNQNNLLSGITDTQFAPKSPMTRGMLAYVLYKHSQNKDEKNYSKLFSDVKESAYYYKAISWMGENNIAAGMGKNTFKPNDPVTREQLITILYNYSIYLGKDVKSVTIDFTSFDDSEAIHQWAKVPLCWALKNNLIGGRTSTLLAPREATTRAEFATILMRFLNI